MPYNIKDPDYEDPLYTSSFNDAIADYLHVVSVIIKNANTLDDIKYYVDIENWIDYFLLQELTKNVDSGYSSVYLYKKKDDFKLRFGPVWDFDFAYGNADYIDYGPEGFYGLRADKNYWYHLMMQIPEVRTMYKMRALEILPTLKVVGHDVISTVSNSMLGRANHNYRTWPTLDIYVWPNPSEVILSDTYQKQIIYVEDYLNTRIDWILEAVISDDFSQGIFN